MLSLDLRRDCRSSVPTLIRQPPHRPQSPGWQGWVLNFKRIFTPPSPDKPLPLACFETSTKASWEHQWCQLLACPHSVTPSSEPSGPLFFLYAWPWTKLSPLWPFSWNVFPTRLLLVNITQGRQPFKVRKTPEHSGTCAHAEKRGRGERPQWKAALTLAET